MWYGVGMNPNLYLECFDLAMRGNSRKPYVTRFSPEEISARGMIPFFFGSFKTAALIVDHHNGDVECAGLFNVGGRGKGSELLEHLVRFYGVNYVECFAPLHEVYMRLGFEISEVYPFDPEQAPEDWTEELGTPDYYVLRLPR